MKEQQTNGESWRSRIALRLKPPDTLPSGWGQLQPEYNCQLVRRAQQITFYAAMPPREKFSRSFAPFERSNWLSGSSQGAA